MPSTSSVISSYDTLKLKVAADYIKRGVIPTELEGASAYGLDHYLARARKQKEFHRMIVEDPSIVQQRLNKFFPGTDEVFLARSEMFNFGFSDISYHPVFNYDFCMVASRDFLFASLADEKTVYLHHDGEKFPVSYFARDQDKVLGLELKHIASSWSEYSRLFMKIFGNNYLIDKIDLMGENVECVVKVHSDDLSDDTSSDSPSNVEYGLLQKLVERQAEKQNLSGALPDLLLLDHYLTQTFELLEEHFSAKIGKAVKDERKNFNEFKFSSIPIAFWEGVYAFLSYTDKTNGFDSFDKYIFHPTMILMGLTFSSFLALPVIDKYSAIRDQRKQGEELGIICDVFSNLDDFEDLRRTMNLLPRIQPKDAKDIAQRLEVTPSLDEVLKDKARTNWRFEVMRNQI
jgi:hypothetical protein